MKDSVAFVKLGILAEHYEFKCHIKKDCYLIDGHLKLKTLEDIEIFISGFQLSTKLRVK